MWPMIGVDLLNASQMFRSLPVTPDLCHICTPCLPPCHGDIILLLWLNMFLFCINLYCCMKKEQEFLLLANTGSLVPDSEQKLKCLRAA